MFNSSFAISANQSKLPNPQEKQTELKPDNGAKETSNVGTGNRGEDPLDPLVASQAKIGADEAKIVAMTNTSSQSSDVRSVSLDNENSKLVYSVEIIKSSQSLDVKVDAVSGQVTTIDSGMDNELDESGSEDDRNAETDSIEHEFGGDEEHED